MAIYFAYIHYYLVSSLIQQFQKPESEADTPKESGHTKTWPTSSRTQTSASNIRLLRPAHRPLHFRLVGSRKRKVEDLEADIMQQDITSRCTLVCIDYWHHDVRCRRFRSLPMHIHVPASIVPVRFHEPYSTEHGAQANQTLIQDNTLPVSSQPTIYSAPVSLRALSFTPIRFM